MANNGKMEDPPEFRSHAAAAPRRCGAGWPGVRGGGEVRVAGRIEASRHLQHAADDGLGLLQAVEAEETLRLEEMGRERRGMVLVERRVQYRC